MKRSIGFVVLGILLGAANLAEAQTGTFGIGPRVTFQSASDIPTDSSLRIFGGQLKLRMNSLTAIEVSADYESELTDSLTRRVKTMPVQASMLVYLTRTKFAPYVLGGMGWYRRSVTEQTDAPITEGTVTTTVRRTGYHAGLGAEWRLGRHFAIHGDYRYKYLRGGDADVDVEDDGGFSVGSLVPGLGKLRNALDLEQEGTMWNWGLTFFF
jgi:opacity protein-like surface antigen